MRVLLFRFSTCCFASRYVIKRPLKLLWGRGYLGMNRNNAHGVMTFRVSHKTPV